VRYALARPAAAALSLVSALSFAESYRNRLVAV
jgi:hypothetical protein